MKLQNERLVLDSDQGNNVSYHDGQMYALAMSTATQKERSLVEMHCPGNNSSFAALKKGVESITRAGANALVKGPHADKFVLTAEQSKAFDDGREIFRKRFTSNA